MCVRKYILGVDGGGTKTHCALFDREGTCVDFLQWGATNHELLAGGFAELRRTMADMLETLRARNGLQWHEVESVFGLAGVDSRAQEQMVLEILRDLGLRHVSVCNDALLGIYAGAEQLWGVCSLNGTGTGAFGVDPQGAMCHRGGLFALSGDYAGGRILGEEVVRCVYDMLYRGGPETCLEMLLRRELSAAQADLLETLLQRVTDGSLQVKALGKLLFEAAGLGDQVARGVLEKSGRRCAEDILQVLNNLQFPAGARIPVVLIGSLYTKASHPCLLDAMKTALLEHYKAHDLSFIPLHRQPVLGAVRAGMSHCGIHVALPALDRSLAQVSSHTK